MSIHDDLLELLGLSGAKVTFDSGRNNTHPCTFCATPADPRHGHKLVDIGFYPNGDKLTRPVCQKCQPIAKARSK